GVASRLSGKAWTCGDGANGTGGAWPDDISGKAEPYREKLTEAVAEADDELLEKYLETGELSEEEILRALKGGFAEAKVAPVLVGAAAKPIGADRLAHFINEVFPSPADRTVTVTTK